MDLDPGGPKTRGSGGFGSGFGFGSGTLPTSRRETEDIPDGEGEVVEGEHEGHDLQLGGQPLHPGQPRYEPEHKYRVF